jgi:hypothetical protein
VAKDNEGFENDLPRVRGVYSVKILVQKGRQTDSGEIDDNYGYGYAYFNASLRRWGPVFTDTHKARLNKNMANNYYGAAQNKFWKKIDDKKSDGDLRVL